MTGQRLAAAIVAAGLILTGCTPPPEPAPTRPADVTCQLQTVFRGYQRDPGPHRHYPAVCGGAGYELQEFKPGADRNMDAEQAEVPYAQWEAQWTSTCMTAKVGDWVKLGYVTGDTWTCEVLG